MWRRGGAGRSGSGLHRRDAGSLRLGAGFDPRELALASAGPSLGPARTELIVEDEYQTAYDAPYRPR